MEGDTCPILLAGAVAADKASSVQDAACIKTRCCWWRGNSVDPERYGQCAVWHIFDRIDDLYDVITEVGAP
jgi:hypothetical protein